VLNASSLRAFAFVALNRPGWLFVPLRKGEPWHRFNSGCGFLFRCFNGISSQNQQREAGLLTEHLHKHLSQFPFLWTSALFMINEIFMAIELPFSPPSSYSINSVSSSLTTPPILCANVFLLCAVLRPSAAASVGWRLMQRWVAPVCCSWPALTACVRILLIYSHQAISRVLSLNISSDQTDWKGVIRLELESECMCVSVQQHHEQNTTQQTFNTDPSDVNIPNVTCSKTALYSDFYERVNCICPPNRFSCLCDTQGGSD